MYSIDMSIVLLIQDIQLNSSGGLKELKGFAKEKKINALIKFYGKKIMEKNSPGRKNWEGSLRNFLIDSEKGR